MHPVSYSGQIIIFRIKSFLAIFLLFHILEINSNNLFFLIFIRKLLRM